MRGWFGHPAEPLRVRPRGRPALHAEMPVAPARPLRPVDRIELRQRIWGQGFLLPGGIEYVMALVTPIAVDSSMSLLDLSAGLGGPARHVAKVFDVYVTALERNAEVAERGHEMSVAAGLGRRVPIRAYDPETVEFRPRSFDAAFARMLTSGVIEKERLFHEIRRGLKMRGQLAFIDLMLRDANADDPQIAGLRHPLSGPLRLWRMSQYVDCLNNAGFECRAIEDHTAEFRARTLRGWRDVLKTEEVQRMPKRELVALFEDAELWFRCLSAFESGAIGVTRIHAVVR